MEADAIVGTIYAINENRAKESYPTHINRRNVIIATLYIKMHSLMKSSLCLIGLQQKVVSILRAI